MDKYLRPERFEADPSSQSDLSPQWTHWRNTFENFLAVISTSEKSVTDEVKYKLLVNHLSPTLYTLINGCTDYVRAIQKLNDVFIKPPNEIYARHQLMKRSQQSGESIHQYLQALKVLSKECNFKSVTAEQNENDYVRDSFISGLSSPAIRQRLLENKSLSLDTAYDQARSLELAQVHNETYQRDSTPIINSAATTSTVVNSSSSSDDIMAVTRKSRNTSSTSAAQETCYFCGNRRHLRRYCPAAAATCLSCGKRGHFAKVCKNNAQQNSAMTGSDHNERLSCITASTANDLRRATVPVVINSDILARALIDTGSTASFIDKKLVDHYGLLKLPCEQKITMAQSSLVSRVTGLCPLTLELQNQKLNVNLMIMEGLCSDVILGHDVLNKHKTLEMYFGGYKPSLKVCAVLQANVEPVSLFSNLLPFDKPIAIKSRRHSEADSKFIEEEIQKLLSEGVIEPSQSPWRAQTLVTSSEHHRKRMVIDYSQTINRFTQLDAFPLPLIENIVSNVAKYKVFSKIDLKSAYHQFPILEKDKPYTAFEACGNLYQFRRIPFGVTNGVAAFQRAIKILIEKEKLEGVYAYLDDITICGLDQADHDSKLEKFKEIATKYNLTLNMEKSEFSKTEINLLGYKICNGIIKPDSERLKPLLELPIPTNSASLKRALGMFAHYAKWIAKFSTKIHPLVSTEYYPMSNEAIDAFQSIKSEIARAAINTIDNKIPLTVETDASEYAIAATLSQEGRPVAFFSRTLSNSEKNHPAIEKEAAAIVESLRKWRQFLIGRNFKLITDQKSVAFMFDQKHQHSKIKNDKIQRWRLELSNFNFDIVYRPGKENIVADALSRVNNMIASTTSNDLMQLHKNLCHPGVTRMVHWVRSKSLAYSVEDVRRVTASCPICAEIKPRFMRSSGTLIKATVPFERLSMDFKGPLPSSTQNRYILTVVDEFSRFPFAFPCSDLSAATVKKKLTSLFSIFGMPTYIHSDRGTSFVSAELKDFLHNLGIATSYTTPYNPQGNGQTERYNGILWKTIQLALKTLNLPITAWENVISQALHSIRSLLCTTTGSTPHERMFSHARRSSNGQSMPTWLTEGGKALLKNNARSSKYDPIVEEVELIEVNPLHSRVRLSGGRDAVVSNRQLAPTAETWPENTDSVYEPEDLRRRSTEEIHEPDDLLRRSTENSREPDDLPRRSIEEIREPDGPQRRSTRERRAPRYLEDYVQI